MKKENADWSHGVLDCLFQYLTGSDVLVIKPTKYSPSDMSLFGFTFLHRTPVKLFPVWSKAASAASICTVSVWPLVTNQP